MARMGRDAGYSIEAWHEGGLLARSDEQWKSDCQTDR
ncbi:MAG: hypothetical protein KatS3mg110_4378 [Pirellulaceae bacterium]|nr:MAG: hypothetical protein KatS3mg110_4378 [Pirellulaceae bacterium]